MMRIIPMSKEEFENYRKAMGLPADESITGDGTGTALPDFDGTKERETPRDKRAYKKRAYKKRAYKKRTPEEDK